MVCVPSRLDNASVIISIVLLASLVPPIVPLSVVPELCQQQQQQPIPKTRPFLTEVTQWLEEANILWHEVPLFTDLLSTPESTIGTSRNPILALGPTTATATSCTIDSIQECTNHTAPTAVTNLALHLLATPSSLDECVSPTLTKKMTEAAATAAQQRNVGTEAVITAAPPPTADIPNQIIHLHQDVWNQKGDIVRSRLLARLGKTSSRVFARKTTSRRIDATLAMSFLEEHHLWGATRTKYYYGLFLDKLTNSTTSCSTGNSKTKSIKASGTSTSTSTLVAVATFSSRRKVVRDGIPHRSHELIRFCSRRDGTVVGGITKLIKAFVVDHSPDDIVTVVDRDWGPGSGWHGIGFETVHTMSPIVMAVVGQQQQDLQEDESLSRSNTNISTTSIVAAASGDVGVPARRHLLGAGIRSFRPSSNHETEGSIVAGNTTTATIDRNAVRNNHGRQGLPWHVLEKLSSIREPTETLECLSEHGYFPVYDTGVERLMMLASNRTKTSKKKTKETSMESETEPATKLRSVQQLWRRSTPSYATSYYSDNTGIQALLQYADTYDTATTANLKDEDNDRDTTNGDGSELGQFDTLDDIGSKKKQLDSLVAATTASWQSTSGSSSSARLVFSAPSSLLPTSIVEVRERADGWRTVSLTGKVKPKSIYHGMYQVLVAGNTKRIDPTAIASEYLRGMASLALAALELRRPTATSTATTTTATSATGTRDTHPQQSSFRFLYYGLGAGTLPRLIGHHVPTSVHVAVELDTGVVAAATSESILSQRNLRLEVGDALDFPSFWNKQPKKESLLFDCILIDVFGADNLLPPSFYSTKHLSRLCDDMLSPDGIVVQNFHSSGSNTNNSKLDDQIEEAQESYANVFETCCKVESLDSKPNGGNTIVLGSKFAFLPSSRSTTTNDDAVDIDDIGTLLSNSATKAQYRWGLGFDASSRVKGAQHIASK